MFSTFKTRLKTWLFRPKLDHGTILLTQRRIFIIPTRQGLSLAVVLLLMLLADINYNLSLGYALTFLLAMMAFMSMLHTFRNLAHLKIREGRTEALFCGEQARFLMYFSSEFARYQLLLRGDTGEEICFDLPAENDTEVYFSTHARQRGWLKTGRLTLYSRFPLGLFHAWCYLHFDTPCLVYPKPLPHAPLPHKNDPEDTGRQNCAGDEDFAGLRSYTPGDSLPRIAWKSYARGHPLQVKQFSTSAGDALCLNLDDTPDADLETRLSYLTRQLLDAENAGLRYALNLPCGQIPAGNGIAHRNACLRRLALFDLKT